MDMYELLGMKSPDSIRLEIAKKFKICRKQKHVTQKELAKKSGVAYAVITKFEQTGFISLMSLISIAEALDMVDDFDLLFKPSKHISREDMFR